MKTIKPNSVEFQNFKEAVENNKINNTGTRIDVMVQILKENGIRLSQNRGTV